MRLKIIQVGDPALRDTARSLEQQEIRSPEIQNLIEWMRETMHDAPGVGLAAPQVGMPLRLAVIEDKPEYLRDLSSEVLTERERRPVPFHVIINPVLELLDEPKTTFYEGCLSLAGFTALVPRSRGVRVNALNHHGEPVVIEASGWYARILQHEIDHLNRTLYIDRMASRSFMSMENYLRYWRNRTIAETKQWIGWS